MKARARKKAQLKKRVQNKKAKPQTKSSEIPGILLRNCPLPIYEKIGEMKVEILKRNKYRGRVSNEEAIYKLIERCNG